ncbi:glycosyltransferase BC10 isoform X3 [Medicago truncatula]|uniref:glycosyltransferase BC10 isoform X3 n=1 Tax=Medicago truncatula TaxID=3880 RepID=UPI000D2F197F|nr:glycosyltransferase BC10 isoform X3 [Medicago truncatula]
MKKKVVQQKWKKKVFALILVVVLCFGSLLFMQMRYTHVLGLVSLQHQLVSQVQKPKIAFLFIARNRLPLELVWDAFFRGGDNNFSIFVHPRPGFVLNEATTRSSYFLNRQVNDSIQIDWGEASMIEAERILLRHALDDPLNDRFVFLSDSCIPLYNFSYTYDYIMSTPTSFVDSFADTKGGRYNPKMDPVIPVYNWRKGSQWAVLTRKHAKVVVEDDTVFPMFQKFCKKKPLPEFWRDQVIPADTSKIHNCIPDEHYVQTLLAEIDNIYYETEYRREWCTSKGKPSTCFLFARKFTRTAALRLLNMSVLGDFS